MTFQVELHTALYPLWAVFHMYPLFIVAVILSWYTSYDKL